MEMPAYRLAEIEFFERWHWAPSELDGMPISEREGLRKVMGAIVTAEKAEMPGKPKNTR